MTFYTFNKFKYTKSDYDEVSRMLNSKWFFGCVLRDCQLVLSLTRGIKVVIIMSNTQKKTLKHRPTNRFQ